MGYKRFWPTFEKFGVDGQTLLTFDWEDYLAIGVTQSHQIKKLLLDIERRAFYRTYARSAPCSGPRG